MRFDLHNKILQKAAVNPQTINSDTTTVGNIIDTQGFESLEFVMQAGTVSAGTFTPLIEESDNADMSGSNAVADADLLGTEAAAALTTTGTVKRVGYRGDKRYVRLSIVSTGSANGVVGALAILGNPMIAKTTSA